MIIGIVSVVFCFVGIGGPIALVLGVIGLGKARRLGGDRRGQAIAGIVLGIVSMAIGVGFWLLVVLGANEVTDSVADLVGPADPSSYDITVDECQVGPAGRVTAEGTIDNRGDSQRNFEVEVEFVSGGEVLDRGSVVVFDVPAGADELWAIEGQVQRPGGVSCRVVGVNNYLN